MDLSEEMDIPYSFLRLIVRKLVLAGLVESKKGKGGGVRLARNPSDISIYDVIYAINPSEISLNSCIEDIESCNRTKNCSIHKAFKQIQISLDHELKKINFDQL